MVAKTIGTIVSFAWETVAGQRPTTGYKKWCDCTAHPDLNPARDQIETTTLCATNNHTYEDGLRDFGDLAFGANLTQDTLDLFVGANGYVTLYPSKNEDGLGLWVCIEIQGINKAYYVPVKPQDFGLPSGEAGSNKYDLEVYFLPTGDAGWYNKPNYVDETTYAITVSGLDEGSSLQVLDADGMVRSLVAESSDDIVTYLPNGAYVFVGTANGTSEVHNLTVSGATGTVTFTTL